MKEKITKKGFAVVVQHGLEQVTHGFYEKIEEAKEEVSKLRYFGFLCRIYYAEKEIIPHEWNSFVYISELYREGVWPY